MFLDVLFRCLRANQFILFRLSTVGVAMCVLGDWSHLHPTIERERLETRGLHQHMLKECSFYILESYRILCLEVTYLPVSWVSFHSIFFLSVLFRTERAQYFRSENFLRKRAHLFFLLVRWSLYLCMFLPRSTV